MEEKRTVSIKSGKYEVSMEVTQEQYSSYMRPWWCQKQRDKRNLDAMGEKGYTTVPLEEARFNEESNALLENMPEDVVLHKEELATLHAALDMLCEDDRDLAIHILTGDMTVTDYAKERGMKRTTVSSRKTQVLIKLQTYFKQFGYEI